MLRTVAFALLVAAAAGQTTVVPAPVAVNHRGPTDCTDVSQASHLHVPAVCNPHGLGGSESFACQGLNQVSVAQFSDSMCTNFDDSYTIPTGSGSCDGSFPWLTCNTALGDASPARTVCNMYADGNDDVVVTNRVYQSPNCEAGTSAGPAVATVNGRCYEEGGASVMWTCSADGQTARRQAYNNAFCSGEPLDESEMPTNTCIRKGDSEDEYVAVTCNCDAFADEADVVALPTSVEFDDDVAFEIALHGDDETCSGTPSDRMIITPDNEQVVTDDRGDQFVVRRGCVDGTPVVAVFNAMSGALERVSEEPRCSWSDDGEYKEYKCTHRDEMGRLCESGADIALMWLGANGCRGASHMLRTTQRGVCHPNDDGTSWMRVDGDTRMTRAIVIREFDGPDCSGPTMDKRIEENTCTVFGDGDHGDAYTLSPTCPPMEVDGGGWGPVPGGDDECPGAIDGLFYHRRHQRYYTTNAMWSDDEEPRFHIDGQPMYAYRGNTRTLANRWDCVED